jgi:hypothetical protein
VRVPPLLVRGTPAVVGGPGSFGVGDRVSKR